MWRRRQSTSRRLQRLCSSLRMAPGTQLLQVRFVLHLQASCQERVRSNRRFAEDASSCSGLACGTTLELSVQLLVCDISQKHYAELCIPGRFRWSGDSWS